MNQAERTIWRTGDERECFGKVEFVDWLLSKCMLSEALSLPSGTRGEHPSKDWYLQNQPCRTTSPCDAMSEADPPPDVEEQEGLRSALSQRPIYCKKIRNRLLSGTSITLLPRSRRADTLWCMSSTESRSVGSSPDPAELELVARLQAGEDAAFETFTRGHTGHALAVARRLLNNEADAQEAVQDAFLSFFKSIDRFRGEARLSTWLHRMVVNAALMKRRSRGRRQEKNVEDLLPKYMDDGHVATPQRTWSTSVDKLLERNEVRDLVRDRLAELPEDHRTVLLLRDVEGIDTAETAALLGVNNGTIKTRLHRARQALRSLLEEALSDE